VGPGPVPFQLAAAAQLDYDLDACRHPSRNLTAWPRRACHRAPSTTPSDHFPQARPAGRLRRPAHQDGAPAARMKARDAAAGVAGWYPGESAMVPGLLCFTRQSLRPRPDAAAPKTTLSCTTCWEAKVLGPAGCVVATVASEFIDKGRRRGRGPRGGSQAGLRTEAFERLAPNLEQPWQMEKSSRLD